MRWDVLALGCVVALTPSPVADACSCRPPALPRAVETHAVAFVARVVAAKVKTTNGLREYTYEVAVEGVWKGKVSAKMTVWTGSGAGDCTLGSLGDAKRWLFISDAASGSSIAPMACGGTREATAAVVDELVRHFGAPRTP